MNSMTTNIHHSLFSHAYYVTVPYYGLCGDLFSEISPIIVGMEMLDVLIETFDPFS